MFTISCPKTKDVQTLKFMPDEQNQPPMCAQQDYNTVDTKEPIENAIDTQ